MTKFQYLKESVIPKVRSTIDGLPFSIKVYKRAKNILRDKYGETSEVIKVHVQKILQLQVIHGRHPRKIHDFYEKLCHSVQVLDTMGNLREINGNVRITLEKLPQIQSDLVMLDEEWKNGNSGIW